MSEDRKVALVTGSSRNIGYGVALRLAQDGYNIVINGTSKQDACDAAVADMKACGVDAIGILADMGKREDVERLAKEAIDHFGKVDVLINNAAIRPHSPIFEMDEAEWDNVMTTNLQSVFWLIRACCPGMVERGWGRVVNFAGMQAMRGYENGSHISASKHALWGMTKALCKELGPKGITVNLISPGPTSTIQDDRNIQDRIARWGEEIPIGRLGAPEDIGAIVSMLVTDQGAVVNGQMIQANGGLQTQV
ncbi:MAG: SDR family NAD(P)-dependent oxidoreductase [Rhodospirillales bacterium]|jgi:3-oxoacyl-[acyl-carrier protein] reductase